MTLAERCRLCAMPVAQFVPVFGEHGQRINLEHKLRICSPVQVKRNDSLPTQICLCCLSQLDQTYDFYQKVKGAQLLLKAGTEDKSRKRQLSDTGENDSRYKFQFGSTIVSNLAKPVDSLHDDKRPKTSLSEHSKFSLSSTFNLKVNSHTSSPVSPENAAPSKDLPGKAPLVTVPTIITATVKQPSAVPSAAGKLNPKPKPNFKTEPKSPTKSCDDTMFKSCKFCDRKFLPSDYLAHEALHKEGLAFICDPCNKSFITEQAYDRHIARHGTRKGTLNEAQ